MDPHIPEDIRGQLYRALKKLVGVAQATESDPLEELEAVTEAAEALEFAEKCFQAEAEAM